MTREYGRYIFSELVTMRGCPLLLIKQFIILSSRGGLCRERQYYDILFCLNVARLVLKCERRKKIFRCCNIILYLFIEKLFIQREEAWEYTTTKEWCTVGLTLFREQSRAIWPIHHGVFCSLFSPGLRTTNTRDIKYQERAGRHCLYFADKDGPYIVTLTTPTLSARSEIRSPSPPGFRFVFGLSLEFHTATVYPVRTWNMRLCDLNKIHLI